MSETPPQSRSPWRRLLWEVIVFGLLAAAIYGVYQFQAYRCEDEVTQLREEHAATMAELEQGARAQAEEQGSREARLVFESFAAGLSDVENPSGGALDALLRVEPVRFAHLLTADGGILFTSDRKLEAQEKVGEAGAWALGVGETSSRAITPGLVEVAGPLSPGGPVLWLGWSTQ